MRGGVVFPPVRLWWDGADYWLADGFHRLAAAQRANYSHINADIRSGSVRDAQWDSFAANALHGLRWTCAERQQVVQRALAHPHGGQLSNVEIAKHLQVSEKSVRRWRQTLSSASAEDKIRLATRGGKTYPMVTDMIGRARPGQHRKSRREIQEELAAMKQQGSPKVRRLLNIFGNWVFGSATAAECLDAIDRVIRN